MFQKGQPWPKGYILKRIEIFFIIIFVIFLISGGCGGSGGSSSSSSSSGGTITVAWDPVTKDVDGTNCDLKGYWVYYGTTCGQYTKEYVGNVTSYTINGLVKGQTYCITVTAVNTSDIESQQPTPVTGAAK